MRGLQSPRKTSAAVAQSVERILGKDEVRQFKSAQQLQVRRRLVIRPSSRFLRMEADLNSPSVAVSANVRWTFKQATGRRRPRRVSKTGGLAWQGRSSLLSSLRKMVRAARRTCFARPLKSAQQSEKNGACSPADLLCKAAQVCSAAKMC